MKIVQANRITTLQLRPINFGLVLTLATAIALPTKVVSAFAHPAQPLLWENGTYLYGETPQPNAIGKEYVVFTLQDGRVVGALFAPRSEFSCFSGNLQANSLNVIAIGLRNELTPLNVSLTQLHQLDISAQDQKTLVQCQQEIAVKELPQQVVHQSQASK